MIGWELPPHNSGGLGVACLDMTKALSNKGVDIEFLLPYRYSQPINHMKVTSPLDKTVREIQALGLAYDSFKYIYRDGHYEIKDLYSMVHYFEIAVDRIVDSLEFDIVHAHDWLTFRAALRVKARKNCPIILHVHSIESDRAAGGYGNPFVRDIEEQSFLLSDRIIAVSNHTKQAIINDYGIEPAKISVVYNSIDQDNLADELTANNYRYLEQLKSQGYRIVSSVGRLTIQKGLTNLLYAAKAVIDHSPKTIFLILGSGEQYYELIRLSTDLGIGNKVLFAGFQRGARLRDSFRIADLFVMPSISEPFGLTALEAAFYGTPSLVTKQAGVSEILKNCLKVDFWDINEMANQIVGYLHSTSLQETMSYQLGLEINGLSWSKSAEDIIDIYNQHLEGVKA